MQVLVRVRPLSSSESAAPPVVAVHPCALSTTVTLTEPSDSADYLAAKRAKSRSYAFDCAFGPDSSQNEVYQTSAAPLVQAVLGGGNATCFCYGATGAGKTHTMVGTQQNPGVMVLALSDLFALLAGEAGASVTLAYLEIYNENVRDLLAGGAVGGAACGGAASLELREDPAQGVTVQGLTYVSAHSASAVMALLQRGNAARVTEPTRCNATSSRSHAVLQVLVRRCAFTHTAKLSLIDLAGSERALATDARTVRSAEGAAINKSLLALSSCIHALVEGKRHVPYRNSRLTQLLKDSLGGGCRTAMIANVSPAEAQWNESMNTLHWADRAKEIRACAVADVAPMPPAESKDEQAQAQIEALRAECEALRRAAACAAEDGEERARSRRRIGDGGACATGEVALFSPGGAYRPPFLTASAPNFIVPHALLSPRMTPRHGASRAALAEENDALRSAHLALCQSKDDAETALQAARDELACARMERDAERCAHEEEAESLRLQLRAAQADAAAAAAAAAAAQQSGEDGLRAVLSPVGARARGGRRATTFADVTNGCGGTDDAAWAWQSEAPLSTVKAAVKSFEQLASPRAGCTAGAPAHACPVPPSPGRILGTQLFKRFAEAQEQGGAQAHLAGGAAGLPPLARSSSLARG